MEKHYKPHYYEIDQEWMHFQDVQRLQYINQIKIHEANRTSTDDRNKYWEENKWKINR